MVIAASSTTKPVNKSWSIHLFYIYKSNVMDYSTKLIYSEISHLMAILHYIIRQIIFIIVAYTKVYINSFKNDLCIDFVTYLL